MIWHRSIMLNTDWLQELNPLEWSVSFNSVLKTLINYYKFLRWSMHKNPLRCRSCLLNRRWLSSMRLHPWLPWRKRPSSQSLHQQKRNMGKRLRSPSSTLSVWHKGRALQQRKELAHPHWLLRRMQAITGMMKFPCLHIPKQCICYTLKHAYKFTLRC